MSSNAQRLKKFSLEVIKWITQIMDDPDNTLSQETQNHLQHIVHRATFEASSMTGDCLQGNSTIEEVLADYEMEDCTMEAARAMARRYSYTMPDGQVRCILHVLGHTGCVVEPPPGWIVVPERPSDKMLKAAVEAGDANDGFGGFYEDVWNGMIAARPDLRRLVEPQSLYHLAEFAGGVRDTILPGDCTFTFDNTQLMHFAKLIAGHDRWELAKEEKDGLGQ
jgi:hypothetical protein